MNARECSEYLAHQVCRNADSGITITPNVWVELFHDCIQQVLVAEHQQVLTELTALAGEERDSGKRATFFKAARVVQRHLPAKSAKIEV